MATPRADSYSVASGGAVYAGVSAPAPAPSADLPAWIAAQPLNQWFNAPNSILSAYPGASASMMDVYSGTVIAGNKIVSFGGGHGASNNNFLAIYDLEAGTGWSTGSASTPIGQQVFADNSNFGEDRSWWGPMGDRKPNPPHTYSSGVYVPSLNRVVWTGQRGIYNVGGNPVPHFWCQFKLDTMRWVQPEDPETIKDQQFGRASVLAPNGLVMGSNSGTGIFAWNPATNEIGPWLITPSLNFGGYGQYVVDSNQNRLIRVGAIYNSGNTNTLLAIDLETKAVTDLLPLMTGSTADLAGLAALNVQDSPGACVDPINNRLVYPTGLAGGSFYAVDLTTLAVTLVSPPVVAGHVVSTKPQTYAGIYGRIHYHPEWKLIIYNPAGAARTCLMRLQ